MFLLRLAKGLVKGLLIGALIGWGLAAAGFVSMGPLLAYAMAAVVGVVMALVAGKAIWEPDARIEVGMKALAALVVGPALMWVVQRFLIMEVPVDVGLLPGVAKGASVAVRQFPVTALAAVAALVGGFYDVDHSGSAEAEGDGQESKPASKQRIASDDVLASLDSSEALEDEIEEEQQRMLHE